MRKELHVITVGVHGHRPVHQVQIEIIQLEQIQALLESLLDSGVECAPDLAGDEQLLPLHDATLDDVLDGLADLVLILVAVCAVNVPVATLNGVNDGSLDLSGGRLPCSQTQSGNGGASVELDWGIHCGSRIEDVFGCTSKHKLGQSRIHGGAGADRVFIIGAKFGKAMVGDLVASIVVSYSVLRSR